MIIVREFTIFEQFKLALNAHFVSQCKSTVEDLFKTKIEIYEKKCSLINIFSYFHNFSLINE